MKSGVTNGLRCTHCEGCGCDAVPEKLKARPCPFCRSKRPHVRYRGLKGPLSQVRVMCHACHVIGPRALYRWNDETSRADALIEAVARWNGRGTWERAS